MNKKSILVTVFITFLFFIKGVNFLDPDFGWRFKAGEIFLKQGVLDNDPFSYSMPTFPWVDHAWLVSSFIWVVESKVGMWLLSLIFSLIVIVTLHISYKTVSNFNNDLFKLTLGKKKIDLGIFNSVFVVLCFSFFYTFFGIRAQVFSWLMMSILLYFIFDRKRWQHYRFFLPVLFLLWVNLHGSFFIGLAVVVSVVAIRSLIDWHLDYRDFVVVAVAGLSTLINPYRLGVYREVASSALDSSLRWRIAEWMPSLTMFSFSLVVFIPLAVVLVFKARNKLGWEVQFLFYFFLLQALLSRRHLPLFAIIGLPVVTVGINTFFSKVKKIRYGQTRYHQAYKILYLGVVLMFVLQAVLDTSWKYSENKDGFYPLSAVNYLNQVNYKGKLFADYGWGGYLIWKMPSVKLFIDGRMPSWRRKKAVDNESISAMDEYVDLVSGEVDYHMIFERYGIGTVLWKVPVKKNDWLEDKLNKISNFLRLEESEVDLLTRLENDGWKKTYQDDVAVVYQRPD